MSTMLVTSGPDITRINVVSAGDIKENRCLTGIRGVAAVWVVIFHLYEPVAMTFNLPHDDHYFFIKSGFLGVDLFFMLSGFILTASYGRRLTPLSWLQLRQFAIGRVFRILPLHWFILCLMGVAVSILPDPCWSEESLTWKPFIASVFLVQTWIGWSTTWNGPTWSLSAEWLAYIGFAFCAGLAQKVRSSSIALVLGACL